jgi:uncharacterized protein YdhG (YjbR/CyaY superfamily)
MSDFDLYLMRFDPLIQQRLITIRQAARCFFTRAEERLCHSLPAFASGGKVFLFFGAYKEHIAVCVGNDWVDFLKHQYPQFRYTGYTITFRHDEPLPEDVIRTIFEWMAGRGVGGPRKEDEG